MTQNTNPIVKKYAKFGIIATAVVLVALIGMFVMARSSKSVDVSTALEGVSADAVSAADLKIAIVSMDKIQMEAKVLEDLHSQRAKFEEKLKTKLEKEQKALEKEKADIEKSQDVLSQEALQRRVVEYQRRVNALQRELNDSAQAIEVAYQEALSTIQKKHLDPVIEGVIAKKKLSLVIDGRMARIGKDIPELDITDEIINALNKKVSSVKMDKPKGF